jgi:hypothetical protein
MGSANVTLPMLKPEVALKLAQLGFNIPTAELGMKKASFGASLPMPDVRMAQKAVNFTVPVPDLGRKQFGVNLTVPDIQLPRLEVNVSGMPKVSSDLLQYGFAMHDACADSSGGNCQLCMQLMQGTFGCCFLHCMHVWL